MRSFPHFPVLQGSFCCFQRGIRLLGFGVFVAAFQVVPHFASAVDLDEDQVSDVFADWYGLADGTALDDPDGDGWSNRLESAWGTNPLDGDSYFALWLKAVDFETLSLSLPAAVGKQYQLQWASDLHGSWMEAGSVFTGEGAVAHFSYTVVDGFDSPLFFRVVYVGEVDADGDLLGAFEESLLGTSDELIDSDGDQINDFDEFVAGLEPSVSIDMEPDGLPDDWENFYFESLVQLADGDPDQDGMSNAVEYLAGTNPTVSDQGDVIISVDRIAFNYDPSAATTDGLNIRDSYSESFSVPEYVRGGQNKAAAHIRNRAVTILVRIPMGLPDVSSMTIKGVSVDVDGALGDTEETTVYFVDGVSAEGEDNPDTAGFDESEYVEFSIVGTTPDSVYRSDEVWKWMILAIDGDAISPLEFAQTSDHRVYTIWDTPVAPWDQLVDSSRNPWVSSLEFAMVDSGAHGKADVATVSAMTSFLYSGHGLTYDVNTGKPVYASKRTSSPYGVEMDLSGYMEKSAGNVINCYDQAAAISSLSRQLGIDVLYISMLRCGYMNIIDLIGEGACNNPFYPNSTSGEKIVGEDLLEPDRTYFGNHAVASYQDKFYDAILGPITGVSEEQYLSDVIDSSTDDEVSISWLIPSGIITTNLIDVY
tara:strand:+ start:39666 stop:41609 length:1944 start_codon:yes stop_codon:yes gene_type:complete